VIDQYESNQKGKQPTKTASESDQAEASPKIPDEISANPDESKTAKSKVAKDEVPDFVTAAQMLAKENSKTHATPGTPATGTVQTWTRPATTPANNHQVSVYKRKLNSHLKILSKADATVDKEAFIQETVEQLVMHTTNVQIMNLVADLTRQVHALTLSINSYQAKATKFVALPSWNPRSCKSKFTLSFPKDITEDDPELIELQEMVAATKHEYKNPSAVASNKRNFVS
jgi:hypothetical protein